MPVRLDGVDDREQTNRLPSRTSRQSCCRVLLAEDDTDMRTLLASALRGDGYEVVEIADGSELFQTVDSWLRYGDGRGLEAIVTDIRMPAFSGLEVLALLRSVNTTLPVILITAFGDRQTHAEARALGASALFDKPFDVDDLRTVMRNVISSGSASSRYSQRAVGVHQARVLLAEDDEDMRVFLSAALRQAGYAVEAVADGSALLDRIANGLLATTRELPDMIISDIRMPGWSGMDVLASLRQADWSMPVILITAFGDDETHARARRLGAAILLDKPFDIEELLHAASSILPARF